MACLSLSSISRYPNLPSFSQKVLKKQNTILIATLSLGSYALYDHLRGAQHLYRIWDRLCVKYLKLPIDLEAFQKSEGVQHLKEYLINAPFPEHLLDLFHMQAPKRKSSLETLNQRVEKTLWKFHDRSFLPFFLKGVYKKYSLPLVLNLLGLLNGCPDFFKIWAIELRKELPKFYQHPFTTATSIYAMKRSLKLLYSLLERKKLISQDTHLFKCFVNNYKSFFNFLLKSFSSKDKELLQECLEVFFILLCVYYYHYRENIPSIKGASCLFSVAPLYPNVSLPHLSSQHFEALNNFSFSEKKTAYLRGKSFSHLIEGGDDPLIYPLVQSYERFCRGKIVMGFKKNPLFFHLKLPANTFNKNKVQLKKVGKQTKELFKHMKGKIIKAEAAKHFPILLLDERQLKGFLEDYEDGDKFFKDFLDELGDIPRVKLMIISQSEVGFEKVESLLKSSESFTSPAEEITLENPTLHCLKAAFENTSFHLFTKGKDSLDEKIKQLSEVYNGKFRTYNSAKKIFEEISLEKSKVLKNYHIYCLKKINQASLSTRKKYHLLISLKSKFKTIEKVAEDLSLKSIAFLEKKNMEEVKDVLELMDDVPFSKLASKQRLIYEKMLPCLEEEIQSLQDDILKDIEKQGVNLEKSLYFIDFLKN